MNLKISDRDKKYQYSIFAIVHPIIAASPSSESPSMSGQAIFYYHLADCGAYGLFIGEEEIVQILPSAEKLESDGQQLEEKLLAYHHLLNLRKEQPLYIRHGEDLAIMRKMLVKNITKILDYSKPNL